MKKFFSMMAVIAAMFAFASCETTPDVPNEPESTKLATPAVEILDVTETGFSVKWNAVEGATSYTISTNIANKKMVNTAETSFTFENLNKGEYTVRVKATGEGKEDSDFSEVKKVNLTGATSIDWFTQTISLVEDTEENKALGRYPFNAADFNWKGTGVVELLYSMFLSEDIARMSEEDIVSQLKAADGEIITEVNSEEGATYTFTGLQGSTKYTLCAYVTNEAGLSFLAKNEITTAESELTDQAKAWLGTWTAKSTEKLVWYEFVSEEDGETYMDIKADAGDMTYNLEIAPYPGYTDYAYIYGLSVWGETVPTIGVFYMDKNYNNYLITTNEVVLQEGSNYTIEWGSICVINGYPGIPDGTLSFVGGDYETFIFKMTENGPVCIMGGGYLNEEGTATYEVFSSDIYMASGNNYSLYGQDFNENGELDEDEYFTEYHAGEIVDFVKTGEAQTQAMASRKAANAMPLNANYSYNSVVIK